MSGERRIVVTGLGAVSSVGNSVDASWSALLSGRSGIGPVTKFDASGLRCRIAGEVKGLDLDASLTLKEQKRLDPFCHFAVVAADEALKDSGIMDSNGAISDGAIEPERCGVLVSSGIGGLASITEQVKVMEGRGPERVSPMLVPMMIADMASGFLAIRYGFRGPNFGIVSACASGLHSIGEAYWMIRRGDAECMLAGGAEEGVVRIGQAGFSSMHALSERNDDPETASRPFDSGRDGFVPAEGAGVLVLEEEEHAKKRGAKIYAEVVGYGLSADAYHITAPRDDAQGAAAAIKNAFRCAGLPYDEISYINAHGTSTPMNDKCETAAIKMTFGEKAYRTPVSSTKSMTGHMLGAAGGFESVVCVKAIETSCIPPTINQFTPDPDCDLDYVPNKMREMPVKLALKLNFGFGGHNAAVLFRKY